MTGSSGRSSLRNKVAARLSSSVVEKLPSVAFGKICAISNKNFAGANCPAIACSITAFVILLAPDSTILAMSLCTATGFRSLLLRRQLFVFAAFFFVALPFVFFLIIASYSASLGFVFAQNTEGAPERRALCQSFSFSYSLYPE